MTERCYRIIEAAIQLATVALFCGGVIWLVSTLDRSCEPWDTSAKCKIVRLITD